MSSPSIKTIGEVQKEYEQQGENSVHLGFRNAVEAMLRDGFEGSFDNDCYSDALVLTQKMLSRLTGELRVLSGAEGDSFFKLLQKPLVVALDKIKQTGGKARFILVQEDGNKAPEPKTLLGLAEKYPGVLEIVQATSRTPIAHFMVADENMIRVEEKHEPLSTDAPETAIKAKVYFDEKAVADGYIKLFDKTWTKITDPA